MFMLYLDASGTGGESTFAMAGVCVHEGNWFASENRIAGLKKRFGLQPADEIHVKDFCVSYKEQDYIDNFNALSWSDRRDAMEKAWQAKWANAASREFHADWHKKYRCHIKIFPFKPTGTKPAFGSCARFNRRSSGDSFVW